jgi:hypothetical protein
MKALRHNGLSRLCKAAGRKMREDYNMASTPSVSGTQSTDDSAYDSLLSNDSANTQQYLQFQEAMNNINNERDMIQAGAIH